ncbi:MAG: transposase [Spirochaetales bacterium]|nr:transposase [Spirochaetales bacterium]
MKDLFVDLFLESFDHEPDEIVPDFDATDDPLHGNQEGRFFHGYYDKYCYLPFYVFSGPHILAARLRTANIDAHEDTVSELEKIVPKIQKRLPNTRIIVRGYSGFCREYIMA